jgi:rhodanese-related sulfurtransferase
MSLRASRPSLRRRKGIAMPSEINASQLQEMLHREDVQLVEVLPPREYEEEHLPGALNIPLKSFTPETLSQLDRNRPTVVYCWDDD